MKNFWRVFRAFRLLLFVAILGLSLAINVAMFVGGALYSAASAAVETVTGFRTVASRHATEVADLTNDLNAERRVNRELRSEVSDLSDNLVNERQVNRQLRGELADVSDELASERLMRRQLRGSVDEPIENLVRFKGKRVPISEAVENTANSISRRARRSATREIGSMAGEALPWIGTAVIVGVTTMELRDLCNTLRDMNELKNLDISDNKLTSLPESIYGLKSLKKLSVSGNQIPEEQLKRLEESLPDCKIK